VGCYRPAGSAELNEPLGLMTLLSYLMLVILYYLWRTISVWPGWCWKKCCCGKQSMTMYRIEQL